MKAKYICHPAFSAISPAKVFHKELNNFPLPKHPQELENAHVLYRKRVTLDNPGSAILKITADDYYKLYVNGRLVTMGPAPSYPQRYYYNEIDVADFLKDGENVIAVHTYYQGLINRVWVSGDLRQMLLCELTVDGKTVAVSDESWKCAPHTAYTPLCKVGYDTAYMECYDSRSEQVGFETVDFDDSLWGYADIYQNADYTLVKQETLQIDIYKIKPNRITKTNYGFFIDLEQEMVGYLDVTARGKSGDTVILRYAEELDGDGRARYNMRCNSRYEEKWILSGREDRLDNFDYKAFRYVEIHIPDGVVIEDVAMTVRHYPFTQKHSYDTENPELLRILKLCTDTVKYGVQEVYVDCPTREKGQYIGDVSVAARAHVILTGDTSLMRKAILDFCASSFICPGIMAVSGSSLMQEIADYSLQLPSSALWLYKIEGELSFLREIEPYLTGMYEYFLSFTGEDGLIRDLTEKNNIVDWPPNARDGYVYPDASRIGKGLHNVVNAFWYSAVTALDEIYAELGITRTGIADKIKSSYQKSFYKEEIGLFSDNPMTLHASVHSNILPLLFGLCDGNDSLKDRIIDFLSDRGLSSMGTYMSYFALAALVRHGREDLAEKLACDKDAWLNMLSEGATTTFEAWGKEKKHNTSLFHPWSVAPLIIFNKKYPVY